MLSHTAAMLWLAAPLSYAEFMTIFALPPPAGEKASEQRHNSKSDVKYELVDLTSAVEGEESAHAKAEAPKSATATAADAVHHNDTAATVVHPTAVGVSRGSGNVKAEDMAKCEETTHTTLKTEDNEGDIIHVDTAYTIPLRWHSVTTKSTLMSDFYE